MGRSSNKWIIDFGVGTAVEVAALYQLPFEYLHEHVKPERDKNRRKAYRERWWIHGEARPALRRAMRGQERYVATPAVAKHRLFAWCSDVFVPDQQLLVFAKSDACLFGVLHSRAHEVWARAQGTQVRERESGFRYTPRRPPHARYGPSRSAAGARARACRHCRRRRGCTVRSLQHRRS